MRYGARRYFPLPGPHHLPAHAQYTQLLTRQAAILFGAACIPKGIVLNNNNERTHRGVSSGGGGRVGTYVYNVMGTRL